jgi:hypothetical protein
MLHRSYMLDDVEEHTLLYLIAFLCSCEEHRAIELINVGKVAWLLFNFVLVSSVL